MSIKKTIKNILHKFYVISPQAARKRRRRRRRRKKRKTEVAEEKKRKRNGETMNNEEVKEALVHEELTKRHALTNSDRLMLRCYFGYTRCNQIPTFPTRKKDSACEFIRRMLFNDKTGENAEKSKRTDRINVDETRGDTGSGRTAAVRSGGDGVNKTKDVATRNERGEVEEEDETFDLTTLLTPDVPTIFQWDLDSLIKMFVEASKFTENQQISVLRSFTSFDRLYPSDLAISTGYVRLLLVGPVSDKCVRERN